MPVMSVGTGRALLSVGGDVLPYTPTLELWLKANAVFGVSSGGGVTTWPDSSGLGRHATQSTGGLRPTYQAGAQNGRPVLGSDGTQYFNAPFIDIGNSDYTIFAVASSSETGTIYSLGRSSSASPLITVAHVGGGENRYNQRGDVGGTELSGGEFDTPASDGAFHLRVCRREGTNWLNRVDTTDSTIVGTTIGTTTLDQSRVFASSQAAAITFILPGRIAEVIVYSSALALPARLAVENYLNRKYAIY